MRHGAKTFKTAKLASKADYLAPDGSEIRLLPDVQGGGLAHCTLPSRKTSLAVRHKTVEEIWYFIEGTGEVWRQMGSKKRTTRVHADVCITIPLGCHFQFRNTGDAPLCFVIATIPRWPGKSEALKVADHWKPRMPATSKPDLARGQKVSNL